MTKATYPSDHLAGMRVPRGGSMCKNCKYLKDAEKRICGNEYFIEWQRSNGVKKPEVIPGPIDEYCSDWYKPAKKQPSSDEFSKLGRK